MFIKKTFEDLIAIFNFILEILVAQDIKVFIAAKEKFLFIKDQFDIDCYLKEIPVSIDQTREGIERVKQIMVAMKNYSHPANQMKKAVNINDLIRDSMTLSRNEWKYVSEIKLELEPDLPIIVLCGISEIYQALINMIVNAAQAIKEAVSSQRYGKGTRLY